MKTEENYLKKANLIKAFAHPARLMILDSLAEGRRCVGELEKELGLRQAGVSQHLNILRNSGVVGCSTEGRRRRYFLADPEKTMRMLKCMEY